MRVLIMIVESTGGAVYELVSLSPSCVSDNLWWVCISEGDESQLATIPRTLPVLRASSISFIACETQFHLIFNLYTFQVLKKVRKL